MTERFCPHCMTPLTSDDPYCPTCGHEVHVRAASHHLPIGTVLPNGKGQSFLFGGVKGDGGFGMTYIARELTSGRIVAIKEYYPIRCQPQRQADGSVIVAQHAHDIYLQGRQSFLSEASMLLAVSDIPSIVQVLDYFEANNTAYMVMEYLDGQTLKDMMQSQNRFEPTFILRKILPLMRDLAAIHDAGVLHRDIAPDNIMLMPDGCMKLLDFGCARSLEDGKSMTVVLKPGFAPIEQYQTRGQGAYTDLYALCATVYYCITGRIPPAAPDRLSAVMGMSGTPEDTLLPPSALGISMGEEVERLLMWGLSVQPMVRPRTVEDLADRWEAALAPAPAVQPVPQPEPTVHDAPAPIIRNDAPQVPPSIPQQPGTSSLQTSEYLRKNESKILLGVGIGIAVLIVLILLVLSEM